MGGGGEGGYVQDTMCSTHTVYVCNMNKKERGRLPLPTLYITRRAALATRLTPALAPAKPR